MSIHRIVTKLLLAGIAVATVAIGPSSARSQATAPPTGAQDRHDVHFQEEIEQIVQQDLTDPPPKDAIELVGSSIFRRWTTAIQQLAPLPVYNRAFGGARTWELNHYRDRIDVPYRPKIILYYCGSNDVSAGEEAGPILDRIKEFVTRVGAALPATRIYFVSINLSPDKRAQWGVVNKINADVKAYAATVKNLEYIDVNPVLVDERGEPRPEMFLPDGLHLTPTAYEGFTRIIKPVLMRAWNQS
jgi:GDSL-like lipase/acylhydrolase family protein